MDRGPEKTTKIQHALRWQQSARAQFQERDARQTLHVTADSIQSNESNVRARRIACASWPALVGI